MRIDKLINLLKLLECHARPWGKTGSEEFSEVEGAEKDASDPFVCMVFPVSPRVQFGVVEGIEFTPYGRRGCSSAKPADSGAEKGVLTKDMFYDSSNNTVYVDCAPSYTYEGCMGEEGYQYITGIYCSFITSDSAVILTERQSDKKYSIPSTYVPAGYLSSEVGQHGSSCIKKTILRLAHEEVGLEVKDSRLRVCGVSLRCQGKARYGMINWIVPVRTKCTLEDARKTIENRYDRDGAQQVRAEGRGTGDAGEDVYNCKSDICSADTYRQRLAGKVTGYKLSWPLFMNKEFNARSAQGIEDDTMVRETAVVPAMAVTLLYAKQFIGAERWLSATVDESFAVNFISRQLPDCMVVLSRDGHCIEPAVSSDIVRTGAV